MNLQMRKSVTYLGIGTMMEEGVTRKSKKVVMDCEEDFGPEWKWMPKKLVDLIPWAEKYLELVPAEYRDTAALDTIRFLDTQRDHWLNVKVHYYRPETDEEMKKRIADEDAQKQEQQRAERQKLEELKERFNDR